ncbi:MAG: anhydro-N-acetylmuramic acid kinase [Gluconacetobacter diazotrophicus]|nr:anhydro-N-acetylmuramic acid kinase [Gluconacetobacter diazotrophicus]
MERVVGLMSGTSLDGVDAAWIETDGESVGDLGPGLTLPYAPELRAELRRLLDRAASGLDPDDPALLAAERAVTLRHAEAVRALPGAERAALVGFHGQTILHRPAPGRPGEGRTWQIGDAPLLARECGRAVAFDFRVADVAAGGEGAPLVPVFHRALPRAAGLEPPLAVLNLGGVANLTFLGADDTLLACDTGPGNAILDDWAEQHTGEPCDRDGRLAASGRVEAGVLERLLDHPFLRRPAPKSLDRLDFHAHAARATAGLGPANGAATLAAFTAACVAATVLPGRPERWLVCGGGRHNPALMAALRNRLGRVDAVEAVGWDGDALEAQCFAFLAARVRRNLPLSFPGTTGVPTPLAGGRIVEPDASPGSGTG